MNSWGDINIVKTVQNMPKFLSLVNFFGFFSNLYGQIQHCYNVTNSFGVDIQDGVFKTPGFPKQYCDNLRCVYEIEPSGSQAVGLQIEFFDTEMLHDFAEIYQTFIIGGNHSVAKQAVVSGSTLTQRHFYSSLNGGLRVQFISDASESEFAGFRMSFFRFPKDSQRHSYCPMPFHIATAQKQSLPSLRTYFRHDSSCVFLINSTEAIKLTVKSISSPIKFKIYETENFISKRPGETLASLNGIGTQILPTDVISRLLDGGPAYDVEFEKAKSVCECPPTNLEVNFTNTSVDLISPGYPLEYCDDANCTVKVIILEKDAKKLSDSASWYPVIRARINDFQVEMDVDALSVFGTKELIALTDNAKSIKYFTFENSYGILQFASDNSVVEKGFNITLEAYKKPYFCQCPGSPMIIEMENDKQNITLDEKCSFMDCFWEIRTPNKIDFILESESEFIEVANGPITERNSEKLRLDYDMVPDYPPNAIADRMVEYDGQHYITIWYHREGDSRPGKRYIGFDFKWRKRCQCGEIELVADTEEWKLLTSPDYPTPYCNNLFCTYHINAPENYQVVVNITDFFTEIDQDFLALFNGNDTNGTHIDLISGMEMNTHLIKSDDNLMSIVFTSDVSLSMRGFMLWYKSELKQGYGTEPLHQHSILNYFFILFFMFAIIGGVVVFMNYQNGNFNFTRIRFINNYSRRSDSQSSLMNPIFRAPSIR